MDTLEVRSEIGRFDTCNENDKSARAFPGVTESSAYCLIVNGVPHAINDNVSTHSFRGFSQYVKYFLI